MPNENLLMFTYVPWYLLRGLIGSWKYRIAKKKYFDGVIFFVPNFDEGKPSIDFE